MTEIEKLTVLRDKLIARRRTLVESFQRVPPERLTGESITEIQGAIEAVNRAIEDETHAESTREARRRAVPA
jgi:hypothetical protein